MKTRSYESVKNPHNKFISEQLLDKNSEYCSVNKNTIQLLYTHFSTACHKLSHPLEYLVKLGILVCMFPKSY